MGAANPARCLPVPRFDTYVMNRSRIVCATSRRLGVAPVECARRSCELDRHATIPALVLAAERASSLEARSVAAVQAQAIRGLSAASSSLIHCKCIRWLM